MADAASLDVNNDTLSEKFLFDILRYESQLEFNFLRDALTIDKVKIIAKQQSWFG